ncbi:SEC7-like protein [Fistulina hepatica ATCC 64428]|uniref:SEC7-like protein n=1 Tax=Fistulina hepatica ATCC 64428 TaxID=1128425 RepID=A0A0D7AJ08_9AGAR|nr:SEC7-like protein [Fistulina hepatica ATCC 64428]
MSPKDALSSTTPDPTSSLSDYPARSTSETSSISSRFSPPAVIVLDQKINGEERHGSIILQRLDESLARGSRSPMWASAIDEPSRKLLMSSPVLQVVNANTVKDRFLFLFTDLLVIAKPVFEDPATIDDRHFSDVYGPSPTNRRFIIKNVVLLRHLRFHDDLSADLASKTDAPPRNPRLRLFVHQFNQDPEHAVLTLFLSVKGSHNPRLLGQLLFKTLDLDRARLGQYLSMKGSKVVLKAFLDNFGFLGLRIDRALRAFLLSIHVDPSSSSFDYLVDAFASRWYEANAGILAYDKDLALRLVRALVQLNEAIHGGLAEEYGPGHYPSRYVPSKEFVSAFRRFDPKNLISNQFLEDVYVSIAENQLAQARNPLSARTDLTIAVKRPIPTRLTYKVKSDPVVLRIPNPDNDFSISLFGDGLVFDPPCLTFTKSCEASFRITGVALGPKTMIMCRSGQHALAYGRLPLSSTITVGRAFMRNTFQLAFSDHKGNKRRYMFSVDDHLLHTLIGDDSPGPETMDSSRLNGDQRPGRGLAEDRTLPFHARSKSRSKVYHQYGAGRNELELGNGDDTEGNSEQSLRLAGKTWSVEDIELQCQQNSSIALVLSCVLSLLCFSCLTPLQISSSRDTQCTMTRH